MSSKASCIGSAILVVVLGNLAAAQQPAQRVAAALADLDRWLATSSEAKGWQTYLKTADLQGQLLQPGTANRDVVAGVLAQYQSKAPGLEMPRFAAVRNALEAWLADLSRPTLDELAAKAAGATFKPADPAEVAAARAKLQEDLAKLNRFLGTGKNGKAWRDFLTWDALQGQLAEGAVLDSFALADVRNKLASQRNGLNLPAFTAVKNSLGVFEQRALAGDPKAAEEATKRMEKLAAGLGAVAKDRHAAELDRAAGAARWLAARGQPEMLQGLKPYYSQPNMFVQMSAPLVAVGIERKVNRTEPVTDVILGTYISGMGTTSGYVSAHLVPSPHQAIIESVFNGVTYSRTLGRNGPARINSAGRTTFQVRKRIYLDDDGIKTTHATASADTRTRTLGVDSGRGGWLFGHIADSIAANRVAQSKGRSQAIASDHAEDRLTRRVEQDANPRLADGNRDFQNKIRYPLLEQGQYPGDLNFSTDARYLYAIGTEASPLQLGAPDAPPKLKPTDLTMQVHETALNNLADPLANDRVTQKGFEDWMIDLRGSLPKAYKPDPERPEWAMTFAEERPIRFRFDGDVVTVTLNLKGMEGSVNNRRRWVITGTYHLEPIPGGLLARRTKEIDVEKPEGEELSGTDVGQVANIVRQFQRDLFKEEYRHEGLELSGEWAKAGKLPLVQWACRQGWLALAWRKP